MTRAVLFRVPATAYALLAAILVASFSLAACAEPAADADTLIIETRNGPAVFTVELADTPELREKGLMYREELAADAGMLFDFGETRMVTMWMRNTPLPLDMLFINGEGRILHIAEQTVPYSEAIVSSRFPVSAVFEVNGGTARDLGIEVGDVVRHPLFGNVSERRATSYDDE